MKERLLSAEELDSGAWRKISEAVTQRITTLRKLNDSLNSTEIETAARRGAIQELTRFLNDCSRSREVKEDPTGELDDY